MAKKPSERRNFKEEGMELNLTPMMNLIAILIPALLVSTVFVEIAMLNVAAPALGGSPSDAPDEPDPKVPLNLTVTVTDKGYTIAATGAVLGPDGQPAGEKTKGPTIPITQRSVSCKQFIGTWPPPRHKNRGAPKCAKGDGGRTFWVYDARALQKKLVDIKDVHPEENRIIIAAEPEIEFEAITDVMDASRDVKQAGGDTRILFDEVVLSPGMS